MSTLIFVGVLVLGLFLLPKIFSLLDSTGWGVSFPKDFVRSLFAAVLAGSSEKFYRMTRTVKTAPRIRLLWLGLNNVSLAWMFCAVLLTQAPFFLLHDFLAFYNQSINFEDPPQWIFWLGSSDWIGLSFGFAIGVVLRLVVRVTGLSLPIATGYVSYGMMSIGVAWGMFLGDYLTGAGENFLRTKEEAERYRLKFSLAFGLAGLLMSPLLLGFTMDLVGMSYSSQLRWFQWISLVVTMLFSETMTSLLFFHFYWGKQAASLGKLTKV